MLCADWKRSTEIHPILFRSAIKRVTGTSFHAIASEFLSTSFRHIHIRTHTHKHTQRQTGDRSKRDGRNDEHFRKLIRLLENRFVSYSIALQFPVSVDCALNEELNTYLYYLPSYYQSFLRIICVNSNSVRFDSRICLLMVAGMMWWKILIWFDFYSITVSRWKHKSVLVDYIVCCISQNIHLLRCQVYMLSWTTFLQMEVRLTKLVPKCNAKIIHFSTVL